MFFSLTYETKSDFMVWVAQVTREKEIETGVNP